MKETLLKRVKREAMRTYMFTVRNRMLSASVHVHVFFFMRFQYSKLYTAFSVSQLSSMFGLAKNDVHSIVSKVTISTLSYLPLFHALLRFVV